ncbi:Dbl homology domain-containing protein [Zopfochytrium polystomum]|nr:Dbl homology domain-containing protein [Zopfochytrium polystomum]
MRPRLKISGSTGTINLADEEEGDAGGGAAGGRRGSSSRRRGSTDSLSGTGLGSTGYDGSKRLSLLDKAKKRLNQEGSVPAGPMSGGGSGSAGTLNTPGAKRGSDGGFSPYMSSPSLLVGSPGAGTPRSMFPRLPAEIACSGLPKAELMRLSVVYEFIDTERDYVNDLLTMMNYHKSEIKASRIISEMDRNSLFSNVDQLVEANSTLLSKLLARREQNPLVECIGDIIWEAAESLKVYTIYCANYPLAIKLLKQLQMQSDFKDQLQRMMQSDEGRGLSLESFLIKPVQRICKYPLLLRELLKNTDKMHKDYAHVEKAIELVGAVVTLVNEATDALDKREKILSIQSKIDSVIPLTLEHKKLVKDGMVNYVTSGKVKEKYLVLFTDVLLVCKTPVRGRNQLESISYIGDLSFKYDFKNDPLTRGLKHYFQLSNGTREPLTFSFSGDDEKTRWSDAFLTAIRSVQTSGSDGSNSGGGASSPYASGRRSSGSGDLFDGGFGFALGSRKEGMSRGGRRGAASNGGGIGIGKKDPNKRTSLLSYASNAGDDDGTEQVEVEMVEIKNQVWKRAMAATGHYFFYNTVTKETTWKLPEVYTVLDPATGKPYPTEEELAAAAEEANARSQQQVPLDQAGEEESFEPEIVNGWPEWRLVDRGDGNPYYFHESTLEVSWYPPGTACN